jgi:hypothetical protein
LCSLENTLAKLGNYHFTWTLYQFDSFIYKYGELNEKEREYVTKAFEEPEEFRIDDL